MHRGLSPRAAHLLLALCVAGPAQKTLAVPEGPCCTQRGAERDVNGESARAGSDNEDAAGLLLIQTAPARAHAQLREQGQDQFAEPLGQDQASGARSTEQARREGTTPTVSARVWDATKESVTGYAWPEQDPALGLMGRTRNVGIAISGGGGRSFAAGYGQIRALNDLGLMKQARYLTGTSGGSWVSSIYTYHQTGHTDEQLLGTTPAPSELTLAALTYLPRERLGWGATGQTLLSMVGELLAYIARGRTNPSALWVNIFAEGFLNNYGLGSDKYLTFSQQTLQDILDANPSLCAHQFTLPASTDRPFWICAVSMVGPLEEACTRMPYPLANSNYCLSFKQKAFRYLEASGLYTGRAGDQDMVLVLGTGAEQAVHEGGLVESFAFGSPGPAPAPGGGASPGARRALPKPSHPWSLKKMLGASSSFGGWDVFFYENGTRSGPLNSVDTTNAALNLVTQPLVDPILGLITLYEGAAMRGPELKVFNTSEDSPATRDTILTDGAVAGDYPAVFPLLSRGVSKIISFFNAADPLCSEDDWDPAADQSLATLANCISEYLPPMFGVPVEDPRYGYEDRSAARLQIFPQASFAPFVKAMQANMKANRTAYARMSLTTVANDVRKIPENLSVDLALFYLSTSDSFLAALPQETQAALDTFTNFPYYAALFNNDPVTIDLTRLFLSPPQSPIRTGLTSLTPEQVNLIAAQTGWAVMEHQDDLKDMFA